MKISLIIPALNEAPNLPRLLRHIQQERDSRLDEVIVVDAGSGDDTVAIAHKEGADLVLQSPQPGRARQMNLGAIHAKGDLLYFVHADTLLPPRFLDDIEEALAEGFSIGCYRYRFDSSSAMLKFNAYCTRFDRIWCRGGDQSLFVTRDLFDTLGGYRNDYRIMEDYDFIIRARKQARFKIMPQEMVVSARKYDNNSYLRVNLANLTIFMMYFLGASQEAMVSMYKRLLDYR
jgi:rSAM/selenodomain-associated transferase 2